MSDMSNTIPLAYVSRSFCDVVHYTIICIYINPSSQRYGETHNTKAQYSIQNIFREQNNENKRTEFKLLDPNVAKITYIADVIYLEKVVTIQTNGPPSDLFFLT